MARVDGRAPGRPPALTDERRERILEALRGGLSRQDACSLVGIDRQTLYRGQRDDPEFHRAVEQAEGEATRTAVDVIWRAIQQGDPKWAAWWLAHRRPRQWGDNATSTDLDHQDDREDSLFMSNVLSGMPPIDAA